MDVEASYKLGCRRDFILARLMQMELDHSKITFREQDVRTVLKRTITGGEITISTT
jgi:hypothetical protein